MEDPRLELHRAIIRAGHRLGRAVKPNLERFGLTGPEYGILRHLGAESLTLSELGQRLLKLNSNITALIDNLESRGLVQRVRDGGDRRIVRVRLTEAGRRLRAEAVPSQNRLISELLAGLDEEEVRVLLRLLAKVEEMCGKVP